MKENGLSPLSNQVNHSGRFKCKNHLWVEADSSLTVFRCVKCGAREVRDDERPIKEGEPICDAGNGQSNNPGN